MTTDLNQFKPDMRLIEIPPTAVRTSTAGRRTKRSLLRSFERLNTLFHGAFERNYKPREIEVDGRRVQLKRLHFLEEIPRPLWAF